MPRTTPFVSVLAATLIGCAASTSPDPSPAQPPVMKVPGARRAEPAQDQGAGESPLDPQPASRGASSAYPAPHPSMPQIPRGGGVVLHDPNIVTVTFAGDPWAAKLASFGEQVGRLSWWSTVNSGYDVGAARSGGAVAIPSAAPSSLTDGDIQDWLAANIADRTLPAPTDQTIYTLYYPQSTTVRFTDAKDSASSCSYFLGYHTTMNVDWGGSQIPIAYAVINRCSDTLDDVTVTASHEFTEAATDPHPIDGTTTGYVFLDDNAWTGLGGENADMCSGVSHATEGGWALTRVWSNSAAAAGSDPCLPSPAFAGAYYDAGIVNEALSVAPGHSVQTEVDCYSFGPLPAPMALEVWVSQGSPLKFGFDKKTCSNGDKVTMTVSAPQYVSHGTDYDYELAAVLGSVRSTPPDSHYWRGAVHVR